MPGPSQISCTLFSYGVFLGQVFSGHPGTLTRSFSIFTLAVAMHLFGPSLKWVMALLSSHIQYSPGFVGFFVSCFSINFW